MTTAVTSNILDKYIGFGFILCPLLGLFLWFVENTWTIYLLRYAEQRKYENKITCCWHAANQTVLKQ